MKNKLIHLSEFEKILKKYQMSSYSKGLLKNVEVLLLVSPSAAGRNTIIAELVKSGRYHYIVSDTTRKPRINNDMPERNGVEYWFKSEDEFLEGLRKGNYIEAAVIHSQQVSGMSIKEIEKAESEHKIAVTDIEIQGVSTITAGKPDSFVVFVLPPSFETWISRLEKRGSLPKDEKIRRLNSALAEFEVALKSDNYTFLINDSLAEFIEKLDQIISTRSVDSGYQQLAKKLTRQLQKDTKDYLQKLATGTLD